jgi:hypothetical protein
MRRRKPIFMVAGLIQRLLWLPIALLPWICPHRRIVAALTALTVLANASGQMAGPAFMSWRSDFVPLKVRGALFSLLAGFSAGIAPL